MHRRAKRQGEPVCSPVHGEYCLSMTRLSMDGFPVERLAGSFTVLVIALIAIAGCVSAVPPTSSEQGPGQAPEQGAAAMKPTPPGMVNTVLGPLSPDQLGQVLVHEHFVFSRAGWYADATLAPYDRGAAMQAGLNACLLARAAGINTIIDATPNDCGRDPELYRGLSRKTLMNIICSTGLYYEGGGAPGYWQAKAQLGQDISRLMAELFIKEIREGIGTTGIRAGVIKVASSEPITPYEEAVFKAAVMAQKATGAPIITHTQGPGPGIAQADLFIREGADLSKVMIGHVSNNVDITYHQAIMDRGLKVGFDQLGLNNNTDEINILNIAELCRRGYAGNIMLSQDTVNYWLGRSLVEAVPPQTVAAMSNWKIDHVARDILPALKNAGVTDEQIAQMMVGNPRNLFTGQ
jgi:phosphotriesterase-related protein